MGALPSPPEYWHSTVYSWLEDGVAIHSSILTLENPMDRGAWQAAVHSVAQSQTWLKQMSMHACMCSWHLSASTVKFYWNPPFSLCPGVHEFLCVPYKSRVSASPSPVEFLQLNLTGLPSLILWGLLLPTPGSQAGDPMVGLKTFTPVRWHLWHNYFPGCGSHTWSVWNSF